jgi:hypothetical protein
MSTIRCVKNPFKNEDSKARFDACLYGIKLMSIKQMIFTHSHNLARLCDERAQLRTGPKSLLDFMLLVRYNVAQ